MQRVSSFDELKRGYVTNNIVESRKETGIREQDEQREMHCNTDSPVFGVWYPPASIAVIRGQSFRTSHVLRKGKDEKQNKEWDILQKQTLMSSRKKCRFHPSSSCIVIQSGRLALIHFGYATRWVSVVFSASLERSYAHVEISALIGISSAHCTAIVSVEWAQTLAREPIRCHASHWRAFPPL